MYVYAADTWCDSCGLKLREELTELGLAPEDPEDEYSYDSDNFPKYAADDEATDSPDHCASAGDCLEGVDLHAYGLSLSDALLGAETRKVGALLSDRLTSDGVSYLVEMLEDGDETPYQVALDRFWRETFADELDRYETARREETARAMGEEDGKAAASWFFDGNTPEETYAYVLRGLEDGDPQVLDTLPSSPLSGEYAGGRSEGDVLGAIVDDWETLEDWDRDEILDAYVDAYETAAAHAIEAEARRHVPALDVDETLRAYIVCALWSSTDEDGEPLDAVYGPDDVSEAARASMREDVEDFLLLCAREALDLSPLQRSDASGVMDYSAAEMFGHDFWLTRNRHGAGFWDRGIGELGDILTKYAHAYGESDLYVSDDVSVEVSP